jgi:hypothetical protein
MKLRASLAAVGATAVVAAGAFLLPALASPAATSHTLKFISDLSRSTAFTKSELGQQDTDVNKAGKTIGFDVLFILINPRTGTAKANATIDTRGGFLYAVLNVTNSATSHGSVTGGTGAFKGAAGTVISKALNKARTRTAVTIVYHT